MTKPVTPAPVPAPVTPTARSSKFHQILIDVGERVGATFLQAFLATVLATAVITSPSHASIDWLNALGVAALAAVVALLTSVLTWMVHKKAFTNKYLDLLWRTSITFAQTLLGYLVAAGAISAFSFNWNAALLAALLAAGQALLKGLVGFASPSTTGASVLLLHSGPPAVSRRV